jgi:uncharacterized protein
MGAESGDRTSPVRSAAMSDSRPRFHLAFPVDDLTAARQFYGGTLGCPEGRSDSHWVDFDLYGHQLVAHLVERGPNVAINPVDGDDVPVPHFGLLLEPDEWRTLADRLLAADVDFVIAPHTRFAGEPGEQSTMFVLDPAGNALEFKAFADESMIFAT